MVLTQVFALVIAMLQFYTILELTMYVTAKTFVNYSHFEILSLTAFIRRRYSVTLHARSAIDNISNAESVHSMRL